MAAVAEISLSRQKIHTERVEIGIYTIVEEIREWVRGE